MSLKQSKDFPSHGPSRLWKASKRKMTRMKRHDIWGYLDYFSCLW